MCGWEKDREGHAGALAKASNERMETLGRHWPPALRTEYIGARRLLTLEAASSTRSSSRLDMQAAGRKVDLMPLQVVYF